MIKTLIVAGIFNLSIVDQTHAQETGLTYIERELEYLMTIWPGDYDNQEQVSMDAKAQAVKTNSQPRFHTLVSEAEIPSLGEYVLYVEKHKDADMEKIYQQHFYVLSADEENRAVRATVYELKNGETFRKAYGDENTPVNISKNALRKLPGCDILIRRDSYAFAGEMQSQSCQDGKLGFLEQNIRLTETEFSFQERRVDSSGAVTDSIADFKPRIMRKARWFACMIDVPKDIPGRSNHTQHYIKIHDQGGHFDFTHPDGREMSLIMRNNWSYGMQRDTFVIVVLDADSNKTLVYSWGSPGADRIGVNPGYVRIQCDLDNPNTVKLQHGLRAES